EVDRSVESPSRYPRDALSRRPAGKASERQEKGAHLDTPTKVRRERASVAELESSANPQPGKAALRSARFPACGFWRLSSRQMVVLSRCAPRLRTCQRFRSESIPFSVVQSLSLGAVDVSRLEFCRQI